MHSAYDALSSDDPNTKARSDKAKLANRQARGLKPAARGRVILESPLRSGRSGLGIIRNPFNPTGIDFAIENSFPISKFKAR